MKGDSEILPRVLPGRQDETQSDVERFEEGAGNDLT
jgi:hypothetical protein